MTSIFTPTMTLREFFETLSTEAPDATAAQALAALEKMRSDLLDLPLQLPEPPWWHGHQGYADAIWQSGREHGYKQAKEDYSK